MKYDLNNKLGVYLNGAGGILVGKGTTNWQTALDSIPLQLLYNRQYSKTVLSPELDAKIGVTYNHTSSLGDVRLDLGWMWVNYADVQYLTKNITIIQTASVGFHGAYLGLKWLPSSKNQ